MVIANKLNEGSFSILHLNVRGLSKNIENIKHLIGSVNGSFSVTVTEYWCDESTNKKSLLKIPSYVSGFQTKNESKGEGLCFLFIKL